MLSAWKSKNLIRGAFARTHGFDVYEERHPHSYLPFRNSIFSSLDRIFCISEHGTDYLKHRYEYQERFRTFRLGVEDREPVSTQLNSGFVRLMSVSSIVPVKNLELLIKVIAAIDDIRIDWRHIGSGNRDYEDSVLRLAEDYLGSKSNVTYSFMGHLSHEDVMQTIQAIRPHALMNTSSFEGIPVSMMEAASMGIPLIGPNICGVPEIIRNGINGFLFELGSVTEASDRIRTLANLTPEAYQEMCANSLSIQRTDFSAETNFRTLSETILNCC